MEDETKEEKRARKHLAKLQKAGHGFFSDFKVFISKGNIIQLAVAFIMGAAFTAIVTSLVGDIFMPFINAIFGRADVKDLTWSITDNIVIKYGNFIMAVMNFLLVALILFCIVKLAQRANNALKNLSKKKPGEKVEEDAPLTKTEELLTEIRDLLQKQPPKTSA